ncbi:xylose ABC transporter ATP-binding protein [Geobacillus vulcani]|uniref:Xylose import ATP-binding protein XylG n=2 Tax=Geobacillus TaxID=129337 RepID=XYLG_GEOKA|nr:xylose ABC transporter ATP-binding protein [Geobacillus kaustophilus]Q5KYS1.1 RecName: Full=Xylose import ATP-binding protein XylG [Geobacillus kaustophilus HTA426]MED4971796.1 xylose ABC transporter ATP-binding protein [Geobacillus thermoleovorans]QCK83104.1 xylose ABC transporter ATP-binding protein [Geobacillus kaustophilus NBRC 102445]BAD76165.1 D-xylose ABC transporter (ATP binding protein) [Geobacillus kaustophilus HTA426]
MQSYVLEMKGITKEFPGVRALDNVTFSVRKGEIHALCGENGAGKSTLMKVLSGVYPYGSYDGKIYIEGKEVRFRNIKESQEAGIAIIYQELAVVEEMTVAENLFLGHELMRGKYIDWNRLYSEAQKWLQKIGLDIDPETKVRNLTVGKQQLIEIAKALSKNAKIIILDEPTAALTDSDVATLKNILCDLRSQGVTCIYISHRLNEVMELADTVTVLRDGQTISTDRIELLTEEQIIAKMVGRELNELYPYEPRNVGKEILKVDHYSVIDEQTGREVIHDVSFSLKAGEILGISGLMGSGRTELFTSLFGAYHGKKKGTVWIDGKQVDIRRPAEAIQYGMAYVSEDRKKYGLVLEMDIIKNSTLVALKKVTKWNVIDHALEVKQAEEITKRMKLKAPTLEAKVSQLSGGNQQKVVLSKWLLNSPKILILDEPTRGIDVGAKYEIYKIINELASQGVGIVLISSELPEVMGMSDRILVMSEGRITGEFQRHEATQEKIMTCATGGK